jgi:methylated-DNA-[protein]-cysteine S-methyltransferase
MATHPAELRSTRYDSPLGRLTLVASDRGLRSILWPGEPAPDGAFASAPNGAADIARRGAGRGAPRPMSGVGVAGPSSFAGAGVRGAPRDDGHDVLIRAAAELDEYFRGERRQFNVPLDPVGTEFQLLVWSALRGIPFGRTATYGHIAQLLGDPRKARAVGAANAANPLPIVVGCHRIVGSDGGLTGFSGGLAAKHWLLDFERLGATAPQE